MQGLVIVKFFHHHHNSEQPLNYLCYLFSNLKRGQNICVVIFLFKKSVADMRTGIYGVKYSSILNINIFVCFSDFGQSMYANVCLKSM